MNRLQGIQERMDDVQQGIEQKPLYLEWLLKDLSELLLVADASLEWALRERLFSRSHLDMKDEEQVLHDALLPLLEDK